MRSDRIASLILRSMVWSDDQQEVLGDLLGDRRRADWPLARADVLDIGRDCAGKTVNVNAGMLIEILVFSRNECGLDHVGNRLDRQIQPLLLANSPISAPSTGMDARGHRRLVFGQHLIVRQVL